MNNSNSQTIYDRDGTIPTWGVCGVKPLTDYFPQQFEKKKELKNVYYKGASLVALSACPQCLLYYIGQEFICIFNVFSSEWAMIWTFSILKQSFGIKKFDGTHTEL